MRSVLVILLLAASASAEPSPSVEAAIGAKLAAILPADLGVAQVHVPASLANASPETITIEAPRELRAGRPSVKVSAKGHRAVWVPVTLAPLVEVAVVHHAIGAGTVLAAGDFTIERRAFETAPAPAKQLVGATISHDVAADTVLGSHDVTLAAATPRGTHVAVEIRHGGVRVKGAGVLELAARPGEPATVRLAFNQSVVHGTLVAPGSVVVGDMP
jgi:flagella basal body P-ring formation protein FlgA